MLEQVIFFHKESKSKNNFFLGGGRVKIGGGG